MTSEEITNLIKIIRSSRVSVDMGGYSRAMAHDVFTLADEAEKLLQERNQLKSTIEKIMGQLCEIL